MHKYLVSVAMELDGHAGATAAYVQTKNPMSRSELSKQIVRLFRGDTSDVSFEEYVVSQERKQIGQYYGDIVTTYKNIVVRTPIAVLVTVLPTRITTDKMYVIESRTG